MKRIVKLVLMVLLAVCGCCGCAGAAPIAESASENSVNVTVSDSDVEETLLTAKMGEESSLSSDEPAMPELLTKIQLEAGTPEINAEILFVDYDGQDVVFENLPTKEELREAGAIYPIVAAYQGQQIKAEVEIVDTTPPVIEGVRALSVYVGDSIAYKQNIVLTDNANGEIELNVDNSNVNLAVPGIYTVYYTATDKSGNKSKAQADITVNAVAPPSEEALGALLDAVLAQTVTDGMSQWDKAYELWKWCRNNLTYTSASRHFDSLEEGAYYALTRRSGDCYIFYASYAALLDRCGIPNIKVSRINGSSNHYWNLVNTGFGWYHCDTSPRARGHSYFKCFMQTDAQLQAYMAAHPTELHPNYYTFDAALYPERGTEVVFGEAPPPLPTVQEP